MPEPLVAAIGHPGGAYLPLDQGGDAGEGSVFHQLGEGGRTGAEGVLIGIPCRGLCLKD